MLRQGFLSLSTESGGMPRKERLLGFYTREGGQRKSRACIAAKREKGREGVALSLSLSLPFSTMDQYSALTDKFKRWEKIGRKTILSSLIETC